MSFLIKPDLARMGDTTPLPMNNDHWIALTLAAVVHGVFLFAFNHPRNPPTTTREPIKTGSTIPLPDVFLIPPEAPPPEILVADNDPSPADPLAGMEDLFRDTANEGASTSVLPLISPVQPTSPGVIRIPGGLAVMGIPVAGKHVQWSGRISGAGELDSTPMALARPAPRYPAELRRNGQEGEAVIEFVVGTDGRVRSSRIVSASHPEFGDAAVAAVARWRFEPGTKNGRTVSFRMTVPVVFSINN